MKLFTLFLILAVFLQTTLIPINLTLILLFNRSLIVQEKTNFYLAFLAGVLLGIISTTNLGFYPILFLIYVKIASLIKRSPLSNNIFSLVLTGGLIFISSSFLEKIFLGANFSLLKILVEVVLSLPIYFLVRIWEERFMVKPHIKLKIKS